MQNPAGSGGAGDKRAGASALPPMIVGVTADGKLRYAPVVTTTPMFQAKDIRETTTPAQRAARAAELKAAAEEKARGKLTKGKKGKGQRSVNQTKTVAPKKDKVRRIKGLKEYDPELELV